MPHHHTTTSPIRLPLHAIPSQNAVLLYEEAPMKGRTLAPATALTVPASGRPHLQDCARRSPVFVCFWAPQARIAL